MSNIRNIWALCVAFALAIGVVAAVGLHQAERQVPSQRQQEPVELPNKLRTLQDLALVEEAQSLSKLEKTEVLLRWLIEERRHPTPVEPGITGGPVGSFYIQRQILECMGDKGEPRASLWLVRTRKLPASLRRILAMLTDDLSDPQSLSEILTTLGEDPNPYLRAYAARELYYWDDPAVESALEHALEDTFVLQYQSIEGTMQHPDGRVTWRPVVEVAEETLRNRHSKDFCPTSAHVRDRALSHQRRLEGYEEFVREQKAELQRLLAIAMSDSPDKMNLIHH